MSHQIEPYDPDNYSTSYDPAPTLRFAEADAMRMRDLTLLINSGRFCRHCGSDVTLAETPGLCSKKSCRRSEIRLRQSTQPAEPVKGVAR